LNPWHNTKGKAEMGLLSKGTVLSKNVDVEGANPQKHVQRC